MPSEQVLSELVTDIDHADSEGHLSELVDELVRAVDDSTQETLESWLDHELREIAQLGNDDQLLRIQAVTIALSLGANTVKKAASKVRSVLNRWIARLGTWMVGTLKKTHQAVQVYLEISVKFVTIGIAW